MSAMTEVNEVMVGITCVTEWELILQTSTDAIPNIMQFSDSVINIATATTMQKPVYLIVMVSG